MIAPEQVLKLKEVIEEFASARETLYYVEDTATSHRQVEDARLALVAADSDLDDFIRSITA